MIKKEQSLIALIIVATSFVLWSVAELVHETYLPQTRWVAGVDLVYFPSAIRLLLLLVGGAAAAVGIAISNMLSVGSDFSLESPILITVTAFYTAFAPLFGLWVTLKLLRLERGLKNLEGRHLPLLCLGTSVISAVLHSVYFDFMQGSPSSNIIERTVAMALGDFTGSLIVVYSLSLFIRFYRSLLHR
jgi:hypothetical protein